MIMPASSRTTKIRHHPKRGEEREQQSCAKRKYSKSATPQDITACLKAAQRDNLFICMKKADFDSPLDKKTAAAEAADSRCERTKKSSSTLPAFKLKFQRSRIPRPHKQSPGSL